ncbi:MAG: glycosyltransferase family 39 protein [Gemmataceae bacterium]
MSEMPRFKFGDLLALLLVVVAAGGLRGAYLWFLADQGNGNGPWLVQDPIPALKNTPEANNLRHDSPNQLDLLVYNLKEKRTFAGEAPLAAKEEITAHTAPGYPWVLSVLENAPLKSSQLDQALRWLQSLLGTLTAAFYFFFARRAFHSSLVGAIAGLLCAANPFWIVNTAEINDGVLASFLLAFALMLGARASQQGGAATSLLYGLLLAALAMVRAALVPFGFAAMICFLLRCRAIHRGWLYALLAFLGFANALAPWTMRNYQQFGEIMPLVDSVYLHLWEGNNPDATGGPQNDGAMRDALAKAREESSQDIDQEIVGQANQSKRYNRLAPDVIKQIRENPAAALRRRLNASLDFFFGETWFTQQSLTREGTPPSDGLPAWLADSHEAIVIGALLAMLILGVLGWRWTYGWRWESMPSSLAMVWIPLPYILSHAEALSGPRLPLDGVLLSYAAFVLACLAPPVARHLFNGGGLAAKSEDRL